MGFSTIANSCDKCVLAKIRHTSGGQEWHEEIRLQAFQDVPFRAKAQLTQVIGERECRRKAAAAGVSGTKAQAQPAGR
jgi:hypothetical protein